MDFFTEDALSMLGGDNFTQINNDIKILNDTVVFKAQTQTITGDKTFDIGTTTTFDGDVNNNGTLNNNNILENHTIINNLAGAVIDNQSGAEIRLSAGSKITANSFDISPIELGYLNNASSNLQTQLDGKVSKTLADTISAIKTFSVLPESSVVPTTADQLVNKTYADGKVSKTVADTISGLKTFTTLPESSVVPTTNSQLANKKYVDDTVVAGAFVTLANPQTITGNKTMSGTTTFTGNITANALTITPTELGYLDGASSNLQTQITARALDSAVVHKEGTETINGEKTFTGTTNVAYTNGNTNIQFANVPNYTFIDMCSGGNGDYDVRLSSSYAGTTTAGRGSFAIEAGSNTITATNGSNTINASTGNVNNLAVNGSNKLTVGASIIAINPTTQTTISTDGSIMVDVTTSRTKLSSFTVDLEGVLITPSIRCGTFSSNTFLSTGVIYANQTNNTITTGGVAMSIGGFAKTDNACQQSQLPINVVFFGCVFWSDSANQTTARRITLEMTGVDRYYVDCPTGSNYRSLTGVAMTANWSLPASNGYYLQIKTSGSSDTHKSWNIALYYYQY
jgi:hypothetical protein